MSFTDQLTDDVEPEIVNIPGGIGYYGYALRMHVYTMEAGGENSIQRLSLVRMLAIMAMSLGFMLTLQFKHMITNKHLTRFLLVFP